MNTKHAELLQRLDKFSPDSADASFPFSSRLAKENQWPLAYAKRVIAEYKRFAFLAVAAGHPVSPSEAIDQAWHLHLTYTQSYWKTFCPEVLQMPFHHNPTKGGADEHAKFADWYQKTIESYRTFFGEPPQDIWPTPQQKSAEKNEFIRVDKETHWVIPKFRLPALRRGQAVACFALIFLAGCQAVANPFNWTGPTFLGFFFWLCVACFGAATVLRWKSREPGELESEDYSTMDPYSMAFLNGGRILAVNSAIANLIERKVIRADASDRKLYLVSSLPDDAPPLEKALVASIGSGETIANVRAAAKPVVTAMMQQLQNHGLIVSDEQASKAQWTATLLALVPVLLGIVKIGVGLSRGKPVLFLLIGCAVAAVAAFIAFARRPHRSRRGDVALELLKASYRKLENLKWHPGALTPEQLAMGIGLFGMTALAGTAMADLQTTLRPRGSVDGGSGGCGSSCGGGGGSCGGGGGCGGGGCGGCGGGH
ncbi:MAG: hypothetical protein JWM68_1793 [Verrucomicrobiales bacterium]|nr:hypothetical protein [Verrucomicrobiales bacterium]